MKIHELRAVPGATKKRKRRGRGTGTGQGTTGGRGMNGQKANHHAAPHRSIIRQLGHSDDVEIPLRIILVP